MEYLNLGNPADEEDGLKSKTGQQPEEDDEESRVRQKFSVLSINKNQSNQMSELPIDSGNNPQPQKSGVEPRTSLSGYTMDDFKVSMISNIAMLLDDGRWESLAVKFDFSRDDISNLGNCYGGGGNPALRFLENLVNRFPEVTVEAFKQKIEHIGRKDVADYIDREFTNNLQTSLYIIREKAYGKLEGIAAKLNSKYCYEKGWKDLAELYSFEDKEIKGLENTLRANNSYSPTTTLIRTLRSRKPGYPIESFVNDLESLEFNDVVKTIKTSFKGKGTSS